MQYVVEKIQNIPGLRTTLCYWDDNALIGTPEELAKAAHIINEMVDETGLTLRWGKCNLHGTKQTINKCHQTRTLSYPTALTFHDSLNLSYLKTPIRNMTMSMTA